MTLYVCDLQCIEFIIEYFDQHHLLLDTIYIHTVNSIPTHSLSK